MVSKTIHYCWLGGDELPELARKCLRSWEQHLPNYEIICWNEENTGNIDSPFYRKCLKEKMWAFASDYLRLLKLYEHGGIYLDVDIELIKSLDELCEKKASDVEALLCEEKEGMISAGFILAKAGSPYIKKALDHYDALIKPGHFINIPKVLSHAYSLYAEKNRLKVLPSDFFYPYNPYRPGDVGQLMYSDITKNTYGIHHWQKSWKMNLWQRFVQKCLALNRGLN